MFLIIIFFVLYQRKYPGDNNISYKPIPSATPKISEKVKVTRVFDGDTIEIEGGQKVRYIGIDTPEIYPSRECFSDEARKINSQMVLGKVVEIKKDVSDKDKYDRLLRYVYIDGMFVNQELIKNGYAKKQTVFPDTQNSNLFESLESVARQNKLGLWGICF